MYVHGTNIAAKEGHQTKYLSAESRAFIAEIRERYDCWRNENDLLVGPTIKPSDDDDKLIHRRVELVSSYKDFLDQQKYAEEFDSRSNLHSTVLEEFLVYLFRDMVRHFGEQALIGKAHAFKDIFFIPPTYSNMLQKPHARVERKDHDFVIGTRIGADLKCELPFDEGNATATEIERHTFDIPAVAIECKTYLDKTMLEGASTAAKELNARNPNAIYMVVSEWLKLSSDVNLRKYDLDQIYVLRKQKNTDREFRYVKGYVKNPIDPAVVVHLFNTVRDHLRADWEGGVEHGLERGWLIG